MEGGRDRSREGDDTLAAGRGDEARPGLAPPVAASRASRKLPPLPYKGSCRARLRPPALECGDCTALHQRSAPTGGGHTHTDGTEAETEALTSPSRGGQRPPRGSAERAVTVGTYPCTARAASPPKRRASPPPATPHPPPAQMVSPAPSFLCAGGAVAARAPEVPLPPPLLPLPAALGRGPSPAAAR